MDPVTVSLDIPKPREEIYAFLDVLADHERFTDHLLTDWEAAGPASGVGAKVTARVKAPGSNEIVSIEVIETEPPARIVEESVGAGGRRRTRGTYELEELSAGATRVSFELAWIEAPRLERIGAPLNRAFIKRANGKAMKRLARALTAS
ncbi:MAG: SRPBCC family protein [Solirubrobacterales bacterium]